MYICYSANSFSDTGHSMDFNKFIKFSHNSNVNSIKLHESLLIDCNPSINSNSGSIAIDRSTCKMFKCYHPPFARMLSILDSG